MATSLNPMRSAKILLAWATVAVLAYMTLGRVGLVYAIYFKLAPWVGNPSVEKYALVEHMAAYALLGALLSSAYPRRPLVVGCLLLVGVVLLEFLQTFTPDRHGTFIDACEKIAGGWLGILGARGLAWWLRGGDAHTAPPSQRRSPPR
jgi:VanZ family protein